MKKQKPLVIIMKNNILVTKSSMPDFNEYLNEIKDLWDTHWLTNMGVKHKQLQKELLSYLNVNNIDLLTNGHMALELSLQALNLKGEVITTPFTFASTTLSIVRNGLTPVFCDINSVDFTIDVNKIESLITPKTSAIMPVHVYGNVCAVDKIADIANKYNLKVIYDAAHAFGVKYNNIGIGNFGDVSCFSFHATKVFNTIEGGAVTFSNKKFGNILSSLKNFGMSTHEDVDFIGANAKMNEFCAAMGLCNLKHIEIEINKRKKIVETYISYLDNVPGIQLNCKQKNVQSNYSYFPIIIDKNIFGVNRDTIKNNLANKNIFARKYFYPLTNTFKCFHNKYSSNSTPIAKYISENVLVLPLYADLDLDNVKNICNIILNSKL